MRIRLERLHRTSSRGVILCLALAAILVVTPAHAQYVEIQSFEVAPFIGARLGGTFDIQPYEAGQVEAALKDATTYGFSAGVRFDDFSLVAFRWTQASPELRFGAPFAFLGPSIGEVTLNQFHADFTREFVIPEVKGLRTFVTGSAGVTHLGAAQGEFTRFSFGFGTGLRQFLGSRLAIRAEAQWLPLVVDPSVDGFACGTIQFGGCLVILKGDLVHQFHLSIGPVLSF